jgi:hypothetical protein
VKRKPKPNKIKRCWWTFPLFWKKCKKCGFQFRREWMLKREKQVMTSLHSWRVDSIYECESCAGIKYGGAK